MSHGAIETEYGGYKFRSRLEARWAVFFDALGVEWQYEPQGFETVVDDETIRYLPDFYLPKNKLWVEVKGSEEALRKDAQRLAFMLDYGSPLPHVEDSLQHPHRHNVWESCQGGLLILGDIPRLNFGLAIHPVIKHSKGLYLSYGAFSNAREFGVLNPLFIEGFTWVIGRDMVLDFAWDGYTGDSEWTRYASTVEVETKRAWNSVVNAYKKARQARFEYGETPIYKGALS